MSCALLASEQEAARNERTGCPSMAADHLNPAGNEVHGMLTMTRDRRAHTLHTPLSFVSYAALGVWCYPSL